MEIHIEDDGVPDIMKIRILAHIDQQHILPKLIPSINTMQWLMDVGNEMNNPFQRREPLCFRRTAVCQDGSEPDKLDNYAISLWAIPLWHVGRVQRDGDKVPTCRSRISHIVCPGCDILEMFMSFQAEQMPDFLRCPFREMPLGNHCNQCVPFDAPGKSLRWQAEGHQGENRC